MLETLHNFNLIFEGFVELLRVLFYVGCGDCFNCDEVPVADISSLVDETIGSFADLIIDINNKGLHKFVVGCTQLGSLLLDSLHLVLVYFLCHMTNELI